MFFILAFVMGEEGRSSLSLSEAKKKDHVIVKPPVKKVTINIHKKVYFCF